jgi:hypothetical protein
MKTPKSARKVSIRVKDHPAAAITALKLQGMSVVVLAVSHDRRSNQAIRPAWTNGGERHRSG